MTAPRQVESSGGIDAGRALPQAAAEAGRHTYSAYSALGYSRSTISNPARSRNPSSTHENVLNSVAKVMDEFD